MSHQLTETSPLKIESNHGEPPHPDLENGPLEERNCTDISFCFLFVIGITAMLGVGSIGLKNGQPLRLTYPYDPNDRACGYDKDVVDYPYIYLVTPFPNYLNRSVCVKNCPNNQTNNQTIDWDCVVNNVVTNCSNNSYTAGQLILHGSAILNKSVYLYNSNPVFGRFCMPNGEPYLSNISSVIGISFIQQGVSDLQQTWKVILASIGLAYLFGFVYMLLMRYLSGFMTWLAIILYFVLMTSIGYFCYQKSKDQQQFGQSFNMPDSDNEYLKNAKMQLALAIIFWTITGVSFLIFICSIQKIRLAIAVVKTSALFLRDVPSALIVPLIFGIITICFWALWLGMFIYMFSVGDIEGGHTSPFATIKWSTTTRYLLIFLIFEGFWCNALIHALSEFIIASSCAIWYFSQGGGHTVFSPVLTSIKRALFYHLGSLALGSLILAIVQTIRFLLECTDQLMKQNGGNDKQPMKFIITCVKCCAKFFQDFIEFLNQNAYIQIAISGKNFCLAAKDAFWLIFTNPGGFAIVEGMGHIFVIIGKYFIALTTTVSAYFIVTSHELFKSKLFSPMVPVIFVFIISSLIGHVFMVVYGMGIDTIIQCYYLDEELQRRNNLSAKYCPDLLKDIMGQHSK